MRVGSSARIQTHKGGTLKILFTLLFFVHFNIHSHPSDDRTVCKMDAWRKNLAKSLKGGPFVPYKSALEDVKPELRGVRPNESIHSVYEELEHMRLSQKDLVDFALDPDWKPPEWPNGYWPEPSHIPTEEEWN